MGSLACHPAPRHIPEGSKQRSKLRNYGASWNASGPSLLFSAGQSRSERVCYSPD